MRATLVLVACAALMCTSLVGKASLPFRRCCRLRDPVLDALPVFSVACLAVPVLKMSQFDVHAEFAVIEVRLLLPVVVVVLCCYSYFRGVVV